MRILGVILLVFMTAPSALAQVYSWTDANGKTHYSTTPRSKGDKPKDLPVVQRENIDSKIKTIRETAPETCQTHGGIDCGRIDDRDGSVICNDGYADASLSYIAFCQQAALQRVEFFLTRENGSMNALPLRSSANQQSKAETLTVRLRNTTAVPATGVSVAIVPTYSRSMPAIGPETIPAFSAQDYTLPASMLSDLLVLRDISFRVLCENCKTIRKRAQ